MYLWTPCLANSTDTIQLQMRSLKEAIFVQIKVSVEFLSAFNFKCSPSILQPESRKHYGLAE